MMASTATTAPMIAKDRARSLRCCSRSAADARSAGVLELLVGMVVPLGWCGQGSEDDRVQREPGARAPDQPQGQQQQAAVAGDLPRVLRGGVGVETAAAEAAAVDL